LLYVFKHGRESMLAVWLHWLKEGMRQC
jgi:hypothetical protein